MYLDEEDKRQLMGSEATGYMITMDVLGSETEANHVLGILSDDQPDMTFHLYRLDAK